MFAVSANVPIYIWTLVFTEHTRCSSVELFSCKTAEMFRCRVVQLHLSYSMVWFGMSGLRRGENEPHIAASGTRCFGFLEGEVGTSHNGTSWKRSESSWKLLPEIWIAAQARIVIKWYTFLSQYQLYHIEGLAIKLRFPPINSVGTLNIQYILKG